jgi:ribosomal-protein-alanine N-acetyltransferase
MYLKTERLLLRNIQSIDIPALVEIWTDPLVTRFMGGPRDTAVLVQSFTADVAAGQPDPYDLWPVVEAVSHQVIGHCGLLEKEVAGQPEVELVYVLHQSAWGQGYATEAAIVLRDHAFTTCSLERLVSLIDPHNLDSERVAQKAGMALEKEIQRGDKLMRVYAMSRQFDTGWQ